MYCEDKLVGKIIIDSDGDIMQALRSFTEVHHELVTKVKLAIDNGLTVY